MNSMDRDFKSQKILKEYARKELLSLFKKSVTDINKLRLNNIKVSLSIDIHTDSLEFHVTAFNDKSDNKTFSSYDFLDIDEIKKNLALFIREIKTDDFDKIKAP